MISSPEKPKPFEGQQEAVKTPDQHTPEVPEYNEAGLREKVDQAHHQIDAEQGRVFETADKRIEAAPGSVGLDETKAAPIRQGFMGRIENIKGKILELGVATKTRTQEKLQPAPELVENKEREKVIEESQEKRGNLLTNVLTSEVASQGLDLVPFAGGGKMLVESISGKTLSGQKLKGKDRIIHAAIGAGSLALDFTGVGELAKGGAILGKSVGVVEKLGVRFAERGALKSAAVFEKTAAFMAKHPEAVAKAEQFAETKIQGLIKQVKAYRGGQREFSPDKNPTASAETIATDAPITKAEVAPEQTQTTDVETPQSAQVENNTIGKETKDFSKKYGSLARDVLAGQLRQMKVELTKGRSSKQESLQGEIVEKEANLKTLEQEYSQLEQKLDHEKNSFVSRLFKKTELSKLEQDLQERKATLEAVKKDVEERYQMLDEVRGLAGAEQDRAEVRKKLDEFYKDQAGVKEQFESEQGARSVEEISKKEGVFFIHAMPLTGEQQRGSAYNNAYVEGNSVDLKTKLKLVMGLEPTLACSTIKKGDTGRQMAKSAGMILGRGRVLFAKEQDAYTVTEDSPFIRRSKDASETYNPLKSDIQQNPEANIKQAIQHLDERGRDVKEFGKSYNELVVENPECAGFFFDSEAYRDTDDEGTRTKIEQLQQLAQEFQVPLYMWKDGKMQNFEGFDKKSFKSPDGKNSLEFYDGYKTGQEISSTDLLSSAPQLSRDVKQQWAEDAVAERPFRINSEAQKMYNTYSDGERVYKMLNNQPVENPAAPHTSWAFPEGGDNRMAGYLQALDNSLQKREDRLKEISTKLANPKVEYWQVRDAISEKTRTQEDNEGIYTQVYAIGEAARKSGDVQTVKMVVQWLQKHSALEKCQQFVSERIDTNGQLKFIPEKDVPKEVRERLAK